MTEIAYTLKTISELARHYGVSKQAVSKAVKKLLAYDPDTPVERNAQGGIVRVSAAHYDVHRQGYATPSAPEIVDIGDALEPPAPSTSFEEARRQAEWLKVDRARTNHLVDTGALLHREVTLKAVRAAGGDIRAALQRLPNRADDLAIAVSRNGTDGAREALRRIGDEMVAAIWKSLEGMFTSASAKSARSQDPAEEEK